ncbi:S-formylglutathione hydrolase FrmB [Pedobacter sp. CAN_A7]|uniref:alpha/beta hydrolase n=1 Tax=Pedobacter sp. CAN_A7 TaxID=2787722 RepID=UPI001A1E9353
MSTYFKNRQLVSRILYSFLLLFFVDVAMAASVDTVVTYSESMKKKIKAVVVLPAGYGGEKRFPTVYLLHGYSGGYADYIRNTPAIKDYADRYQLIIVCADGRNSWYLDSPVDSTWKYETYVAKELVGWIDKRYSTIADLKGRAIMGLSMGGHGALSLAIKHQDVFGAAGSMSGGLDLRPFPGNWEISKRLGSYALNADSWKENSVMEMIPLLSTHQLALIIDCGEDDFFYPVNLKFHEQLKYNNIAHDFISRPGNHDWKYWTNAISYQFLYFNNFFQLKKV